MLTDVLSILPPASLELIQLPECHFKNNRVYCLMIMATFSITSTVNMRCAHKHGVPTDDYCTLWCSQSPALASTNLAERLCAACETLLQLSVRKSLVPRVEMKFTTCSFQRIFKSTCGGDCGSVHFQGSKRNCFGKLWARSQRKSSRNIEVPACWR